MLLELVVDVIVPAFDIVARIDCHTGPPIVDRDRARRCDRDVARDAAAVRVRGGERVSMPVLTVRSPASAVPETPPTKATARPAS